MVREGGDDHYPGRQREISDDGRHGQWDPTVRKAIDKVPCRPFAEQGRGNRRKSQIKEARRQSTAVVREKAWQGLEKKKDIHVLSVEAVEPLIDPKHTCRMPRLPFNKCIVR